MKEIPTMNTIKSLAKKSLHLSLDLSARSYCKYIELAVPLAHIAVRTLAPTGKEAVAVALYDWMIERELSVASMTIEMVHQAIEDRAARNGFFRTFNARYEEEIMGMLKGLDKVMEAA